MGTKQTDMRDNGEAPTMRHRATFAASEKMVRVLPPAFWMKKNELELRKILGSEAYEATLQATEDAKRSHTRDVKGLSEKIWEEKIPQKETEKKSKKSKAPKTPKMVAASA